MSAFLFNNKRIHKMKNSLNRRYEMKKSMDSLEKTLEEWNSKLIVNQSSLQKNSVYISNSFIITIVLSYYSKFERWNQIRI